MDKYLGCTFICSSRASGRGIIMDTGSTVLISEQTLYRYQLTNQSIHRKNIPKFWLQLHIKRQNLRGSSLCRIYTIEPSLFLSIHCDFSGHIFLYQMVKESSAFFFSKNGGQLMMMMDHSYFPYNIVICRINFCSKF